MAKLAHSGQRSPVAKVRPWHVLSGSGALVALDAGRDGLDDTEAARRLEHFGPNRLPRQAPPPPAHVALRRFRGPLICLLAIAAPISVFLQEYKDDAFIRAVLLIDALIGTAWESRAERAGRALQHLLQVTGTVRRNCEVQKVGAEVIVPADEAEDMAQAGFRVLTLAEGPAPAGLDPHSAPPGSAGLRCVGLVGKIDPLRKGVEEVIAGGTCTEDEADSSAGEHPRQPVGIIPPPAAQAQAEIRGPIRQRRGSDLDCTIRPRARIRVTVSFGGPRSVPA